MYHSISPIFSSIKTTGYCIAISTFDLMLVRISKSESRTVLEK